MKSEFYDYTKDQINKNLVLIEDHYKTFPCPDCLSKHWTAVEGYSEEMTLFDDKNNREKWMDLADKAREMRKNITGNSGCSISSTPNSSTKGLNIKSTSYNYIKSDIKLNKQNQMVKLIEVGEITGGAFVGKGVTILGEYIDTKIGDQTIWQRPSTYINVIGGLGLLFLGMKLKNKAIGIVSVGTGAFMLTKLVDYVKELTAPAHTYMPVRATVSRISPNAVMTAPIANRVMISSALF